MRRREEVVLYNKLRKLGPRPGLSVQDFERLAHENMTPTKQARGWLEKWADKGWWNYGVALEGGWFEPGAPDSLTE